VESARNGTVPASFIAPIPTEELRQGPAELSRRRDPLEHLLYRQHAWPEGHRERDADPCMLRPALS
jgi:hypothetical protein